MWPPAVISGCQPAWDPHAWSAGPQQEDLSRVPGCGSRFSSLQEPSSAERCFRASLSPSCSLLSQDPPCLKLLFPSLFPVPRAPGANAPARLWVARTLALCPDVGGRVFASYSLLKHAHYSLFSWHLVSCPVPISFCIKVSLLRTPVLWTYWLFS